MELKQKRKEIDALDETIIKALEKRFDLSLEIGRAKKKTQSEIKDTKRETEIREKTAFSAYPEAITAVYDTILSESKALQRK